MTLEENKALLRRVFDEALNGGNFSLLDRLFAEDFVDNATPDQLPGPRGVRDYFQAVRAGFPDMRVIIDDLLAEGDKVVVRTTWRGTHLGSYEGIAPTGKTVSRSMIQIFRVSANKIQEEWSEGGSLSDLLA
ncbi:MAG TPA: ester cyclase [Ktedonobacteraceae bacterium]|nr:ester cyclase [Ktedonobacteraceae bacterium]